MKINSPTTLKKFIICPEQKKKTFSLTNLKRKKEKRNKRGLLPQRYYLLSEEDKQQVKASMIAYNSIYGDKAYFEPEEYFYQVYTQVLRLRGAVNV